MTESEIETESERGIVPGEAGLDESERDESDPNAPQLDEHGTDEHDIRFVLVPVPREHVLDVMRWVLFRVPKDAVVGRRAATVKAIFEQVDEQTLAFLLYLANAALEGDDLRLIDAAEEFGQDARWITSALRLINHLALERVVWNRSEKTVGIDGQKGRVSYVTMRPDIARLVRTEAQRVGIDGA